MYSDTWLPKTERDLVWLNGVIMYLDHHENITILGKKNNYAFSMKMLTPYSGALRKISAFAVMLTSVMTPGFNISVPHLLE